MVSAVSVGWGVIGPAMTALAGAADQELDATKRTVAVGEWLRMSGRIPHPYYYRYSQRKHQNRGQHIVLVSP